MNWNRSRNCTDDTNVALRVWYTPGGGTAAVAGGGDLTLIGGGVTTAYDLSTPATLTTMGKLRDAINAVSGWIAVLVDVRASDSTDDCLLTFVTTNVPADGLDLCADTSVALKLGVAITNVGKQQTDKDRVNYVNSVISLNTYGAGTSIITVYECDDVNLTDRVLATWACAATTVEQIFPTGGLPMELFAVGKRILAQMVGSAHCTGRFGVVGYSTAASKVIF